MEGGIINKAHQDGSLGLQVVINAHPTQPPYTHINIQNRIFSLPLGHRGQQSPSGVKGVPSHRRTGHRVRCRGGGHNRTSDGSSLSPSCSSPQIHTYIALAFEAAPSLRNHRLFIGLTLGMGTAYSLREMQTHSQHISPHSHTHNTPHLTVTHSTPHLTVTLTTQHISQSHSQHTPPHTHTQHTPPHSHTHNTPHLTVTHTTYPTSQSHSQHTPPHSHSQHTPPHSHAHNTLHLTVTLTTHPTSQSHSQHTPPHSHTHNTPHLTNPLTHTAISRALLTALPLGSEGQAVQTQWDGTEARLQAGTEQQSTVDYTHGP